MRKTAPIIISILTLPRASSCRQAAAGLLLVTLAATNLFAATPTRINLAKYQPATSSVQSSTYDPELAVDGSVSNFHCFRTGNITSGSWWLAVSYNQPISIASAHLYLGVLASTTSQVPASFRFQYSNDGTNWTDVPGSTVSGNTLTERNVVFSQSVTAKYFRLYSTATGSNAIRELAFFPPNIANNVEQGYPLGTDVRLNLAYLRPATSSSADTANIYGAGYSKNAFDGYIDNKSRWVCTNASGEYIEVDLLDTHAIASAHVFTGFIGVSDATHTTVQPMADFKLQYYTGSAWADIPGASVTGNTAASLVVTFNSTVTTSKVRLVTTSASNAKLQELLLFPPRDGGASYTLGREVVDAAPPSSKWNDYSDSSYQLNSASTGLRLGLVNGQVVFTATTNTTASETEWQLLLNYRDGSYRIRHSSSGQCLGLASVSTATGASVTIQDYTALPSQDWFLVPDENTPSNLRLVNTYSGLALQSSANSTSVGAAAIVDTITSGRDVQMWTTTYVHHYPKKGIAGTNNPISANNDLAKRYTSDLTLTYHQDFYKRLGGSWSYTWGRQTSDTFPYVVQSFTFNPMQWGNGNTNFTHGTSPGPMEKNFVDIQSNPKPMHLMGFNEPDHTDQSNIPDPAVAIARWPRFEAMQAPLVGPCPANDTGTWQDDFYTQANALGYRRDYTPVHWYASPTSDLIGSLQATYNKYGRPIWLTEFSFISWDGSGSWSDASNFNALAEFMWRAESLPWLKRYSLFVYIEGSFGGTDNSTAPRSNTIRADGSLTAFGQLYAGWDGVTDVLPDRAYHLHNKGIYHRVQNPGGVSGPALLDPETDDAGVQWFLSPGNTANSYRLLSTRDGRPLRVSSNVVSLGTVGQSDTTAEWQLVADQYGWYYLENVAAPSTNKRLKDNGNGSFGMVSSGNSGDAIKWRFVRPAVADAAGPTDAPTNLTATATPTSISLTWSAVTGATSYSVQRASSSSGPWTTVATGLTSPSWTDTGLSYHTTNFYQVIATNLYALDSATTTAVSATTPTPYEVWAATALSSVQESLRGPGENPDRDGLLNLIEYALDTNPTASTSSAFQNSLSADHKVQLTFLRARSELTYEVLASSDLTNWTVISTDPGAVGQQVTVTDTTALDTGTKRFLRLRVTSP